MISKRIISVFLAIMMALTSFSALAQENAEEISKKAVNPVPEYVGTLLEALGIMNSSEVNADREIQRGYAADVLLKLAKITDGTATGTYYYDVTAETTYAYAIEKLTELGYFQGVGDGAFNPNGYIAIKDMARLLLKLAGYGIVADNSIVTSEIYKNVGVAGNTTCRDLAHMIFNLLSMDAMSMTEISKKGGSFAINKNLTVMADFFDVYEAKGTIVENDMTGLWGDTTLNENEFVIDTKDGKFRIENGKTDAGSNLGKYVRVFYQYDRTMDELIALSYGVERVDGIVDVDLFDFDFTATTERELNYTLEGENKKIKYNSQTSIIYNGTFYSDGSFDFNDLAGREGHITVVDNDFDNVADILNVTAYKTYVIKSVVLSDGRVFSKNTEEVVCLDEEEYDKYSLVDKEGRKAYLEDFVPGTILSVAQNAKTSEKQVIKAYAEKTSVSGKITSVYEEDGKQMIQIDENSYYLLPSAEPLAVGKYVEAYLSPFGKIAYIKIGASDDFLFGLTAGIEKNREKHEVVIRLINTDDEFVEYSVAENVKIDSVKYKTYNSIYDKLVLLADSNIVKIEGVSYPKGVFPIRYELNAEGKISLIDTIEKGPGEDKTNSLSQIPNVYSGVLIKDMVIGGQVAVESDTPSFYVSGPLMGGNVTMDLINNYSGCSKMGNYSPPRSFDYAAYTMNTESKYASFIITHTDSAGWDPDKDDTIFVIDKISYMYDSESGATLTKIEGYDAGVKAEAVVSEEYTDTFNSLNLKQGDAIRYNTNQGRICRVENGKATVSHELEGENKGMIIRPIREADVELSDLKTRYNNLIFLYGYVLEREDNIITIVHKSPGSSETRLEGTRSDEELAGETGIIKIPSNVAVTVYDPTAQEKVYAGTYDEILAYDSVGPECSFVALRFRSSSLAEIVVFNNSSLFR